MPRLSDPKVNGKYPFHYIPAERTDIAARFKQIRAQQSAKQRKKNDTPSIPSRP